MSAAGGVEGSTLDVVRCAFQNLQADDFRSSIARHLDAARKECSSRGVEVAAMSGLLHQQPMTKETQSTVQGGRHMDDTETAR